MCAVGDVSFSIADGAVFGLLGPNGAGKTTTMRMIVGILTPDAGAISWNGEPIDARVRRFAFGYLPEERGLYAKLDVRQQIRYFGRLRDLTPRVAGWRTDMWIERLGLQPYLKRPCSELSKGNQQKVQVACAAIHQPALLILDEPFSGLDPVNAEMLVGIMLELRDAGATLVVSSHQMWQLERLCTEYCIVAEGRNRVAGTLTDLRKRRETRVLRVAPHSPAVYGVLDRVAGSVRLAERDGFAEDQVPAASDFSSLLRALVSADAISQFETVEPSLNDIYLSSIGDPAPA
ncbi:MAG: ABC transporter ATP-binding protein [Vulcanimicrobiaceae bacterium]